MNTYLQCLCVPEGMVQEVGAEELAALPDLNDEHDAALPELSDEPDAAFPEHNDEPAGEDEEPLPIGSLLWRI